MGANEAMLVDATQIMSCSQYFPYHEGVSWFEWVFHLSSKVVTSQSSVWNFRLLLGQAVCSGGRKPAKVREQISNR